MASRIVAAAGYARRLLRRIGPMLALVFGGIALSLWGFGELAEDVLEGEPFDFDEPLLRATRAMASPPLDSLFVAVSALGFAWGVIPADVLLVAGLALRRQIATATFVALAAGGSGLLNVAAKHTFRRERPMLWESIAPEHTYSFPSGHAMGSATLACILVLLCWHRRGRWAVLASAIAFTGLVGASRVYLGVHYPSDILAGWAAAIAWTLSVYLLVRRAARGRGSMGRGRSRQPWTRERHARS